MIKYAANGYFLITAVNLKPQMNNHIFLVIPTSRTYNSVYSRVKDFKDFIRDDNINYIFNESIDYPGVCFAYRDPIGAQC